MFTLDELYSQIRNQIPTPLDDQSLQLAVKLVLASIVQRVSAREAAHFISLLPEPIQDDLFSLKAGPNYRISAGAIFEALRMRIGLPIEQSRELAAHVCHVVAELIEPTETQRVETHLPQDMRQLFH